MSSKKDPNHPRVLGFLGVGLDNKDEHQRVTKSEHFLLVGGSEETHERLQDTAIRFADNLRRRGKRLEDTSVPEVVEILKKSAE